MSPSWTGLGAQAGNVSRGRSLGQDIRGLRHQLPIAGFNLLHNHSLGATIRAGAADRAEAGLEGAHTIVEARAGESPIG